ncbi:MAG: phosphoglucosamine mutase [Lentisphaerae bacterium]|nr:phosphoglucosamine mutase [Lentisphaerota bacterium]
MSILFGTDGIRGRANTYPITPENALLVGKAVAGYFSRHPKAKHRKPCAIIGKDTRLSGYMLESAVSAGLLSMGMDVLAVGPMPTPAVAHLVSSFAADCGIMITASHNPAGDNGIKIFDRDGFKLSDDICEELEAMIFDEKLSSSHIADARIGKAYRIEDARGRYIEFAKASIGNHSLAGLKVVLDCANGAAYAIAPAIFRELGAEVIVHAAQPDGTNINESCGATMPEKMCELVRNNQADLGIALDGDADRVIFSDAGGHVVDGDRIIGMLALEQSRKNALPGNRIVVTSMSNLALHQAMEKAGIGVITTDVGDHLVIEAMREHRCSIGGEQSGHIIFMDHVTTGDGIITALHIMKLMQEKQKSLSALADFMTPFPQKTVNLQVSAKPPLTGLTALNRELEMFQKENGSSGRAVVRYSGTENKLRILVETEDVSRLEKWSSRLAAAARCSLEDKQCI